MIAKIRICKKDIINNIDIYGEWYNYTNELDSIFKSWIKQKNKKYKYIIIHNIEYQL
jgi:hypothetical protein